MVTKPNRSLITQSFDARERVTGNGYLNGDGFGVGWYPFSYEGSVLAPDLEETPGLFTSVKPAWNNENLRRLADKVGSCELVRRRTRMIVVTVVAVVLFLVFPPRTKEGDREYIVIVMPLIWRLANVSR